MIAIVDTNADPDVVDYAIPSNDDANKAIELVVESIGEAIEDGLKHKETQKPENTETQNTETQITQKGTAKTQKTAEAQNKTE